MIDRGMHVAAYRCYGGHWWFDRVEDYHAAQKDPELNRYVEARRLT
jgi:hypothetical protein